MKKKKTQQQAFTGKTIPTRIGAAVNRNKKIERNNQTKFNTKVNPQPMPNVASSAPSGSGQTKPPMPPSTTSKIMWQPIPTVGGPENSRQHEKQPMNKGATVERPNLRVVEGTPSTIQLNLDKSKGLLVDNSKASPGTKEQNDAVKPPAKPVTPAPQTSQSTDQSNQSAPQTSGFQGRMTASSFMKQTPKHPTYVKGYSSYQVPNPRGVAGIPRSFLQQPIYQQQLNLTQQLNSPSIEQAPNPTKAPVWEPPPQKRTWSQSSADSNQGGQTFAQTVHTPVQSDHAASQMYTDQQIFVQTDDNANPPKQQYSPSDAYADMAIGEENDDLGDESDSQTSSKRLSAFQRLGPFAQPKKPKLTINLLLNKEQAVREVVDETEDPETDKYTPAHLRADVQTSLDDTVMKYLVFWPWKKNLHVRRWNTVRQSQAVMLNELEKMEELYEKDSAFFQLSVTGYPLTWSKENVLDAILENLRGKSFIPCFIEFTQTECKFLVIRSRPALVAIHKLGFIIRKDGVELTLCIMQISIGLNQIDFLPRLVLRRRLSLAMDQETGLNLSEFTLKTDVSYFIYFPLNRVSNQSELRNLQSSVPWEFLTMLNLSRNRITTLSGFELAHYTPRLKHLDLSYNHIERVTTLLQCRGLPLRSLWLEGNPLCTDYIQQERYIAVLRMMFSELREIDGIKITLPGELPKSKRNYCPPEAAPVVEKLLEVMFPLLQSPPEERYVESLYDINAVMTITYMYRLRYGPIYKDFRSLFYRARVLDEGDSESVAGAAAIAKVVNRWPTLEHDPLTFIVDVLFHSETTTILRISGVMKVTTESLADDEHILSFTRTLVMHSIDTVEYKITNEMIYWDLPDSESAKQAFRMISLQGQRKNLILKLEAPPDDDLKERLLGIFMKLTEMQRKPSERCLELKNWHLQNALEYFTKLLKLDNLQPLLS